MNRETHDESQHTLSCTSISGFDAKSPICSRTVVTTPLILGRSSSSHWSASSAAHEPNTFKALCKYIAIVSGGSASTLGCSRYARSFCGSASSLTSCKPQRDGLSMDSHLQYSPHIQAAAQRTSEQLPSSLALARKPSSHNSLTISWTANLRAALTRAVTSTS